MKAAGQPLQQIEKKKKQSAKEKHLLHIIYYEARQRIVGSYLLKKVSEKNQSNITWWRKITEEKDGQSKKLKGIKVDEKAALNRIINVLSVYVFPENHS